MGGGATERFVTLLAGRVGQVVNYSALAGETGVSAMTISNWLVADARKGATNRGREARMSFHRTEKGFEIDLLVSRGGKVHPVEIKSAQTFNPSFVRNLSAYAASDASAEAPQLVYDGEAIQSFGPAKVSVTNFRTVDWA